MPARMRGVQLGPASGSSSPGASIIRWLEGGLREPMNCPSCRLRPGPLRRAYADRSKANGGPNAAIDEERPALPAFLRQTPCGPPPANARCRDKTPRQSDNFGGDFALGGPAFQLPLQRADRDSQRLGRVGAIAPATLDTERMAVRSMSCKLSVLPAAAVLANSEGSPLR